MKQPNPRLHQRISFVKSVLRIAAGILLIVGSMPGAGVLIIIAEILGIAEELV